VVWDLKINKSVFSFQDSSAVLNRKVSLQWNPEIATQVAVTYDDERVPELQIWDLRNP
jgi:protein transport protein SEC31